MYALAIFRRLCTSLVQTRDVAWNVLLKENQTKLKNPNQKPHDKQKLGENSAAKEGTSRESEGTLHCNLLKDLKNKKHWP